MIIVPAEKLAKAVNKHLLPGLLRSLAEEQKAQSTETNTGRSNEKPQSSE